MEIPPYETLATLARDVDPYAVIEHLQALGSPREVADAYHEAHLDAYWKHKDLPMVVLLNTAGIHYCFTHAKLAADDETRAAFKSTAKGLAYNLASFTWTGWDEPGIVITRADMACGRDAARLNLRLALELQKPFDKVCSAAWLLGAQLLAAGQLDEALFYFKYSVPEPEQADYALFSGYVLLAETLMGVPEAAGQLNGHLAKLTELATESSKFACDQLKTAQRVFTSLYPSATH